MLHKLTLKEALLVENADRHVNSRQYLSMQGDMTEILALIKIFANISKDKFIPSNVFKRACKESGVDPESLLSGGRNQNADLLKMRIRTVQDKMTIPELDDLRDEIVSVGTDWVEVFNEPYQMLFFDPKNIQKFDDLMDKYLFIGNKLGTHIKDYLRHTQDSAISGKWTGRSSQSGEKSNTEDIVVYSQKYKEGIKLSLKGTMDPNQTSGQFEVQSLGVYEEFGIDLTEEAAQRVQEIVDTQIKPAYDAFIAEHDAGWANETGRYDCSLIRKRIDNEFNPKIRVETSAEEAAQRKFDDTSRQIRSMKTSLRNYKKKMQKENETQGYSSVGMYALNNLERNIQRAEEDKKRYRSEKNEAKKRKKQLEREKKQKTKQEVNRKKVEAFTVARDRAQWGGKSGGNNPTPQKLTLPIPNVNPSNTMSQRGLRPQDIEPLSQTIEEAIVNQFEKELEKGSFVKILVNKFIRRSSIGAKASAESSIHMIFHSNKGLVLKSDYEFLKEVLNTNLVTTAERKGRHRFHVSAESGTGEDFEIISATLKLYKKGGVYWLGKPSVVVNPKIEKTNRRH